MDIMNIGEKILPILIITLLVGIAISFAQESDYHCPTHKGVSSDEVIVFQVIGESVTMCGKCTLDFLKDNFELYRVEK